MRGELRAGSTSSAFVLDDQLGRRRSHRPRPRTDRRRRRTRCSGFPRPDPSTCPWPSPSRRAASTNSPALIGEYGWDHDVLYIREKDGKLNALIEWFFEYPLERVSRDVYRFPDSGTVRRASRSSSGATRAAGRPSPSRRSVPFKRRAAGRRRRQGELPDHAGQAGRRAAHAKRWRPRRPRRRGDFRHAGSGRAADSRLHHQATTSATRRRNNFMGTPFYTSAHAFMQRPAAEAVGRAPGELRHAGLRAAGPRRLSAVVRDEDVLGRHAAGQAPLRRRSRRRARGTTAAARSTSRCTI